MTGVSEEANLRGEGELAEEVLAEHKLGPVHLQTFLQFSRLVGDARSLHEVARHSARMGLEMTGAPSVRVLLVVDDGFETLAVANQPGVSSLTGTGLTFEPLSQETSTYTAANRALEERNLTAIDGHVFIPLIARDRGVGLVEFIGVGADEAERFLPFALPTALALEGTRQALERVRREREARALADLARQIGSTLDLDAILERTVAFAAKTLSLERGMLALFDEVRDVTAVSRRVFTYRFENIVEPSVSLSPRSFERLVVRGQPIVLNDVKASSRSYADFPRRVGAESFLMVPLSARSRPLGVLYLDTTRSGAEIRERDVSLAQGIAEQASLAIENARLYADESRKRSSAEALREVVFILGSTLDLSLVLARILDQALKLVGASACAVFELEGESLVARTVLGLETEIIHELRVALGEGVVGTAVLERRVVTVEDLDLVLDSQPEPVQRLVREGHFPFQAVLGLPLAARGRVFGGLALYFDETTPFPDELIRDLELFAVHAAVALENARLYEEEVRRERESVALLRVARLAGATLELAEVLEIVAREVAEALDLERCFLGFFATINAEQRRAELGRLHAYGFPTDLEEYRPFEIVQDAFDQLVVQRSPIRFANLTGDPELQNEGPTLLAAQACVIVPLVAQGQVLGMLYADTTRVTEISERDAQFAQAIADQAALAIQNARLYSAIQSQEARYRLLAEAAHDVIVATDLEGNIVYANPAVERVLGFEAGDLVGRHFAEILEAEAAQAARQAWRSLLEADGVRGQAAASYEGSARRSDGTLAYLEVNLNALRVDGQVVGSLSIARDLSEKRALAEEISSRSQALARESARTLELRAFLGLFTQAQEEERKRIARELHDDTAQTLVAIGRRLDRLEAMLKDTPAARERVADIRADLDGAIDSVRRFSRNLRPSVLDDLGLLPALEWLCEQARTPGRLEVRGPERRLPHDLELTLFRVVQEALTNVDKHAAAEHVSVEVTFDPSGEVSHASGFGVGAAVLVRVRDDGIGILEPLREAGVAGAIEGENGTARVAEEAFTNLAVHGHLGLAGMRERVALAGGEMQLSSSPGLGTTLSFWFPLGLS